MYKVSYLVMVWGIFLSIFELRIWVWSCVTDFISENKIIG